MTAMISDRIPGIMGRKPSFVKKKHFPLPDDGSPGVCLDQLMNELPYPDKDAWAEAISKRVEDLADRMGLTPSEFGSLIFNASRSESDAKKVVFWILGQPKTGKRSIPAYGLYVIANRLGIDVNYLTMMHDDLEKAAQRSGLFAIYAREHAMKQAGLSAYGKPKGQDQPPAKGRARNR